MINLCNLSICAKLLVLTEKDKNNAKEIEPAILFPSVVSPAITDAVAKSASYKPMRPESSCQPPSDNIDALIEWVLGPLVEDWSEEQRATQHRNHSLHFHGVESCSYCVSSLFIIFVQVNWLYTDKEPIVIERHWTDYLPAPDSPDFDEAFLAGFNARNPSSC